MRSNGTTVYALACTALLLAGCQVVLGFEDFEGGSRDGGGDAGGPGAGGGDAGPSGAGAPASSGQGGGGRGGDDAGSAPVVAGTDGGPGAPEPCELLAALGARFDDVDAELVPDDHAQDMVEVRRPDGSCFLIDRLEVSAGRYAELLAHAGASAQPDDGPCSFKTALSRPGDAACGDSSPAGSLPATCVDWCDARAYCRFRGLELCREEFASEAQIDATRSDWFAACSANGDRVYPYGDQYDGSLCNGADNAASGCPGACAPFDVAAGTGCEAASGALNLSGNAAEWTAACRDSTGASDSCRVRGGSYRATSMGLTCDALLGQARDRRSPDVGFRCCFYGP